MRTASPAFHSAASTTRWSCILFGLLLALTPVQTRAEDPADLMRLYAIETQETSKQVKAGETGTFVLRVQPKQDAYISPRTPLSLVVEGKGVKFEQTRLGLADVSAGGPVEGSDSVTPRFDVPFQATAPGPGRIQAKLTFFLCTRTSCIRQVRELEVPVQVN